MYINKDKNILNVKWEKLYTINGSKFKYLGPPTLQLIMAEKLVPRSKNSAGLGVKMKNSTTCELEFLSSKPGWEGEKITKINRPS